MSSRSVTSPIVRWLTVLAPALLLILVPFGLFGPQLDAWTEQALRSHEVATIIFIVVVSLLAVDIILPIPASIVSTMGGALLGGPAGIIASWIGMTLGSLAGYALGRVGGRPILQRLAGPLSLDALERDVTRFGAHMLVTGRAVPVLAEATTLIAGVARMPLGEFVVMSAAANLGVSAVYSTVGALSANVGSFLLAFSGSILLPVIAWSLVRAHVTHRS